MQRRKTTILIVNVELNKILYLIYCRIDIYLHIRGIHLNFANTQVEYHWLHIFYMNWYGVKQKCDISFFSWKLCAISLEGSTYSIFLCNFVEGAIYGVKMVAKYCLVVLPCLGQWAGQIIGIMIASRAISEIGWYFCMWYGVYMLPSIGCDASRFLEVSVSSIILDIKERFETGR